MVSPRLLQARQAHLKCELASMTQEIEMVQSDMAYCEQRMKELGLKEEKLQFFMAIVRKELLELEEQLHQTPKNATSNCS